MAQQLTWRASPTLATLARLSLSVDMICIATDCTKTLFAWRNRGVNQQPY
jgi:hypothetical protein